jgi:YVTN family beta-propeller protein
VIDTVTNTVVATVPVGSFPAGVAVNPAGAFAYVANGSSNTVSVIDTVTNTVVATVPVGSFPVGVAVNPAGTFAYVTNSDAVSMFDFANSTVSVIDTASNTVVATVLVGLSLPTFLGSSLTGVAVNPAGTFVYVANFFNGAISVIDTVTNTVVATVPVGGLPDGVAVNPAGTFVYVANQVSNQVSGTVSVINTASNTVTATVPVGTTPLGVAVNPAGTLVYVTNFASNTVSVIDTATNTVTATVPVGASPWGVAVNPAGTFAYVANPFSNNVSVIDTASNTVVATVPVGRSPIAFGQFIGGRSFSGGLRVLDPVPDLLSGATVSADTSVLATRGREVEGIAADGITRVVLRIPGSAAGEQLSLSVLDDHGQASTSTDEDGALSKLDETLRQSSITVSVVETSVGPLAFAVYTAPTDFVRPATNDSALAFRNINIQVQSLTTGGVSTAPVTIVRSPLALIHGIWSGPGAWTNFGVPRLSDDERFNAFLVNYQSTNGDGFATNANIVQGQIDQNVNAFKTGMNRQGIKVAAVQVDIVAHSMGGDLARTMVTGQSYLTDNNYKQGFIHNLITVDTPHLGSEFANRLYNSNALCKAAFGLSGKRVGDGVRDLQTTSVMITSTLKQRIFPLRVSPIDSVATAAQAATAEANFSRLGWGFAQNVCPSLLPAGGFSTIFGQDTRTYLKNRAVNDQRLLLTSVSHFYRSDGR